MDRFSQGLPDPQEQPIELIACPGWNCDNEMPIGSEVWHYGGEYFCSTRCLLDHIGAERRECGA